MTAHQLKLIEEPDEAREAVPPWKILVVDDDAEVHLVTRLALEDFVFESRPVQIITAGSAASAQDLLLEHPDISLILLDVVMESEHAGLELVRHIRERMQNHLVRIVLRTGQPGQAPAREVIQNYEIDDYRTKTELTFSRLVVVVTAALRTHYLLSRMLEQQQRIAYQATHDELTGLPNRTLLHDRIGQAMAQARRNGWMVGLLFLDLDGFKFVNDSYGHSVGDVLLKAVAERLRGELREGDTVARLGGDEFVIMLSRVDAPEHASVTAQKLLDALSEPLFANGRNFLITGSIGTCLYPMDGDNAETLLKNADIALYGAKQSGRNRAQIYHADLGASNLERGKLETALRAALQLGQFTLHYQPRVEIDSGEISGVEALIRWQHPQLGLVPPSRFIPLAEEIGLIDAIGRWVLEIAARQLHDWHRQGFRELTMAVNMSARQFHEPSFPAVVAETLARIGLSPAYLELEITEGALISNPESAIRHLSELKQMGIALSMDDFGTGYSSLSYLNRLPVDIIKIDRSFAAQLGESAEAESITRTVITLAKFLGKRTICEGVETDEQLAFLRTNGCDAIQGFLFSRAVPAEELLALLQQPPRALGE